LPVAAGQRLRRKGLRSLPVVGAEIEENLCYYLGYRRFPMDDQTPRYREACRK
jgi:hypothetical protein